MQELHIRLFEGAYTSDLKMEQRTTWLATILVLLQLGLLVFLSIGDGFAYGFLGVYLLHMLGFFYLIGRVWLNRHPEYKRHLTITSQGVIYRTGFLQKEHQFDWEEVDEVFLELFNVKFVLKNEEQHCVLLHMMHNETALRQAKQELKSVVMQKAIPLTDSQI
ncbi:hypothetical protein H8S95_15490 [Pontibacter sp. KCTC 32443]|uniref:hypothetical protein n=1 Tax=Pontibacter TaxID=323449 RepID=UPI00164E55F7|nr:MULTISPECIES: hypothetical protein [Pontibacter]MBC5775480.1 hypothetical protein [Pontibacter sp. KCTC 32443]